MSIKEAWAAIKSNSFLSNTNQEEATERSTFSYRETAQPNQAKMDKGTIQISLVSVCILYGGLVRLRLSLIVWLFCVVPFQFR